MIKKIILTAGVICTLQLTHNISAFAQGIWSTKASLGIASNGRSKGAGFELNGMGYIGTGYNGTAKNDFWQYDPGTNVWTQKANFGGSARYGAFGFSVNGFGYIGAGFATPSYVKDVWKYDPTGNSWTQVANYGGVGRMDAASFVIGNRAFVGTGYTGTSVLNDFYKYDPVANTWTAKTNYGGTACCNAIGFSVSGKGYIALGRSTSATTCYNTVYQYDTTANTWTAKANFSGTAREGAAAFVIGSQAYVGTGGSNNLGTLYNDFYKYDPVANSWSAIATFIGSTRSHTCSFAIGNYGYVGMGYTGGQVNNFYKYALCSGTTSVTTTSPSCSGGANGSINLTVAGAVSPLTYLWSNASTIEDITGLTAGSYSVLITDANGCTNTNTISITAPTAITNTVTATNAPCNGGTGSANIAISGGTNPYTQVWSNGSTVQTVSGLAVGNYSVTVTDANGCSATNTVAITQPTALTVTATSTYVSCTSCSDATASATPAGGTPPYTFAWSPSGGSSSTASGLATGTYTVCVIDGNGCSQCTSVSVIFNSGIVEYNSPSISVYPNPSNGEFKILGLKTSAELSVYNCIGVLVYKTDMPRKQENVNITSLPYGIYLLKIKTEEKIFTKKIILTE